MIRPSDFKKLNIEEKYAVLQNIVPNVSGSFEGIENVPIYYRFGLRICVYISNEFNLLNIACHNIETPIISGTR